MATISSGTSSDSSSVLAGEIAGHLPFVPHQLQQHLISALGAFVTERPFRGVFLLNGYAGSGKTSIVGALIKAMTARKMPTVRVLNTFDIEKLI